MPISFELELLFHGDLATFFLPRSTQNAGPVRRLLSEKTGVKDVIEACGIPHTEVDGILRIDPADGARAVDLAHTLQEPARLEVFGFPAPGPLFTAANRLQPVHGERFVADGHLGKLARNLRLLGYDTVYENDADDPRLLEIMTQEDRVLLTQDRRLLMHSIVKAGYCPRSCHGEQQTREVISRFGLRAEPQPLTRCLRCNGPLEEVEKGQVTDVLAGEPLTLRYYDAFTRCTRCGKIYWPGTHYDKLATRLARLAES